MAIHPRGAWAIWLRAQIQTKNPTIQGGVNRIVGTTIVMNFIPERGASGKESFL
jgi:hypothetical protein